MSLASELLAIAFDAAAGVVGSDIVYHRGPGGVNGGAAFPATRGRTEFQADDGSVVRLEHTDADFIFPKDRIVAYFPPQKGDTIRDVDTGELFEVLPADGKQCYRHCDPAGTIIRVYAKQIG